MIYAIKSRTGTGFRRSGVGFLADKWTLVHEPTPEQLAEPSLDAVQIKSLTDPQLKGLEVVNGDELSEDEAATLAEAKAKSEAKAAEAEAKRQAEADKKKADADAEAAKRAAAEAKADAKAKADADAKKANPPK